MNINQVYQDVGEENIQELDMENNVVQV